MKTKYIRTLCVDLSTFCSFTMTVVANIDRSLRCPMKYGRGFSITSAMTRRTTGKQRCHWLRVSREFKIVASVILCILKKTAHTRGALRLVGVRASPDVGSRLLWQPRVCYHSPGRLMFSASGNFHRDAGI